MAQSEYVNLSEAARLSSLSPRTLRRLEQEGRLRFYRSPGGHVRIDRAELDGLLRNSASSRASTSAPVSPVLQNRRERIEELTLEVQELRAKRDLDNLRADDADRRRERMESRRAETESRNLAIEQERVQDRREAEQRERRRRETEESQRRAAFEKRWTQKAKQSLTVPLLWLTVEQREHVLAIVREEVRSYGPADEAIMPNVLSDTIARVCAPWETERRAQAKREQVVQNAVRQLPWGASNAEKLQAAADVREVLSRIPFVASQVEVQSAAAVAVDPLVKAIGARNSSKEAKERNQREEEEAASRQKLWKTLQIAEGVARVDTYLTELYARGEIDSDAYIDSAWRVQLKNLVREELESVPAETGEEAEELAEEIVDEELE